MILDYINARNEEMFSLFILIFYCYVEIFSIIGAVNRLFVDLIT